MTSSEEIKTIQSLKGDTYFGQIFKPDAIDAMCENIRRDYPIDCGVDMFENSTSLLKANQEIKILKGQLEERVNEIQDFHEQKNAIVDFLIELSVNVGTPLDKVISDKIVEMIGWNETIKKKIKAGKSLSKDEKDWLLNNL